MTTDNGGWIVFQRRFDGSTDFYRNWTEYALGFGNITSEFYLGNQIIHEIVREGIFELRIELEDKAGELRYAKYGQFSIDGPDSLYTLHVTGYSGNAGNSLKYHNGRNFTTFDMDNDIWPENCAVHCHGAWWYGGCQQSNLNGDHGNDEHAKGINWFHWHGWYYSMNSTQMMFRVTKH
ncbi:fibrinogen-like protein A [Saccostrea cucullata]|uniref:fibrinogen-like protein A n=1 Tax=Saccostrea cuccullata TaxID=36930 RepID=UPI002ED12DBE